MEKKNVIGKQELVKEAAKMTGISQKQVETCMGALLASIASNIALGKKVRIFGFGGFDTVLAAAREFHAPNGKVVQVPQKRRIRFHPASQLKKAVDETPVK